MSEHSSIKISVTHRGTSHALSLQPDDTLAHLQTELEVLTGVAPENQKLLFKGKKAEKSAQGTTLAEMGLKEGTKITMLGSTAQELGGMKATEDEKKRRERIMAERAAKGTPKVRSTASSSTSDHTYRFHRLAPLPHLPNPPSALALLERLAADPAIIHVMRTHRLSVGVLTELAPHEHPELLGLNVNAGQQIKLRLRTNAYDGFRAYREVRRVLCHELTHNVWGDHDNNFKAMNSRLNREVAEYERSVHDGTHSFHESDVYEPAAELEAEARAYVLGGAQTLGSVSQAAGGETPEERRRKILEATMGRLRKEEEELEHSCGTAGPAAGS